MLWRKIKLEREQGVSGSGVGCSDEQDHWASHAGKGIFEPRLERGKRTIMWVSKGGGFQREKTASAKK